MKFYFCEHSELENRLRFINSHHINDHGYVETIDIESLSNEKGIGRYGTLKYDIDDSGVGTININGFLNNDGPEIFDIWFGLSVTGYSDIITAIDTLVGCGANKIVFNINSPGGEVGIVDNVWVKINNLGIETEAVVSNMCASGGYYIASACDKINASNPLAVLGSIGVVVEGIDASEYFKKIGIKVVSVVSDNAPNKRLGLDSEDGIEEFKKLVNSAERQFIGRISEGRGLDIDHIKNNFGRGGVMHAMDYDRSSDGILDALSVGMIDSVIGYEFSVTKNNGEILMNEEEIKKIEEAATLKANSANVKRVLSTRSYPADIVKVGMDVITCEATIDQFYDAIAEYDKSETAKNVDDTASSEQPIPVTSSAPKKTESDPWVICDVDSAAINAADFRRR